MVSVVIPALNEEAHIKEVVTAAHSSPLVGEVIVVSDGSEDRTAEEAAAAGAKVLRLQNTLGKAEAMNRGVEEAVNEVILFLDGDIAGITATHIETIASPVASGRYDMFIGLLSRKQFWLNRILHFFPLISGQRAVTKSLWAMVPGGVRQGFQIEIALNYYSRRTERRSGFRLLSGLVHTIKEKKYGFWRGFGRRIWMMWEIVFISFRLYVFQTLVDLAAAAVRKIMPAKI